MAHPCSKPARVTLRVRTGKLRTSCRTPLPGEGCCENAVGHHVFNHALEKYCRQPCPIHFFTGEVILQLFYSFFTAFSLVARPQVELNMLSCSNFDRVRRPTKLADSNVKITLARGMVRDASSAARTCPTIGFQNPTDIFGTRINQTRAIARAT